jgi:hypothetical protein
MTNFIDLELGAKLRNKRFISFKIFVFSVGVESVIKAPGKRQGAYKYCNFKEIKFTIAMATIVTILQTCLKHCL